MKILVTSKRPLIGLGFLTGNWYCYQAVVENVFHNAHWPGRVTGQ